jgi:hypothetical protein
MLISDLLPSIDYKLLRLAEVGFKALGTTRYN